jgi:hypothetical protein
VTTTDFLDRFAEQTLAHWVNPHDLAPLFAIKALRAQIDGNE